MKPNPPHGFCNFNGIPFDIVAVGGDPVYPDWKLPRSIVERAVPGSGKTAPALTYRQNMGSGLATWTVRIWVSSIADLRALKQAMYAGTIGRLTILADYSSVRGDQHTIYTDYEYFTGVFIDEAVDEAITPERDAEVTVTFKATVHPVSLRTVS